MSEKIDIFTIMPLDSPYFIVDNTKLSVPLVRPSAVATKMQTAGGLSVFDPGDNFTLLSAGYVFPESFCLASAPANAMQTSPALNIGVVTAISGLKYFPNLGTSGIQLPLENYETPIGIFCDAYNLDSPNYRFRTQVYNLYGTLRGIDESYSLANNFDPTSALPSDPCIGDTYTASATANGWTSGKKYTWSGSAWTDVTANATVPPQVSMVGAPAALNGKKIRVTVFVKILHTLSVSIH